MDRGIADHLAATPLSTLALFSVTDRRNGTIDTTQRGYRAITGATGRRMIEVARERGMRVELVFTSFGRERNEAFFGNLERQDAAIAGLVELVGELELDGVNVDVESMPIGVVEPYGAFVARLKAAVEAADPADRVSVATQANLTGAATAAAAARAGAHRIFLMGYDYRINASWPGAVAPLDRRDDDERDLEWSLDAYALAGVPADRILLGLPLYGRSWPVTDAELGAPPTGRGDEWFPERNVDLLTDPAVVPVRDEIEVVELYVVDGDGRVVPPATAPPAVLPPAGSGTPGASAPTPAPTPPPDGLRAIYVDSPATLERKLGLVDERGLAGGGFWAIGYERGLPAYTELMERFVAGDAME
jgi:spore germination protein YaaH